MDVELLSGACGAEIAGIDLRDTSDDNIKTQQEAKYLLSTFLVDNHSIKR